MLSNYPNNSSYSSNSSGISDGAGVGGDDTAPAPDAAGASAKNIVYWIPIHYFGFSSVKGLEAVVQSSPNALVVDVRMSARSANPRFTGANLTAVLGAGHYIHIPEWGNINYRVTDRHRGIKINDFAAGLEKIELVLATDLNFDTLYIMCGCPNYETCHRKVLTDRALPTLQLQVVKRFNRDALIKVMPTQGVYITPTSIEAAKVAATFGQTQPHYQDRQLGLGLTVDRVQEQAQEVKTNV